MKQNLIEVTMYLIKDCYFAIGNIVFKHDIRIPMAVDPALFWANLFIFLSLSMFKMLFLKDP